MNVYRTEMTPLLFLEELPETSTGKVQKLVLREKEWAGRDKRIH
jgi:fatty-acyl-CoA synthase